MLDGGEDGGLGFVVLGAFLEGFAVLDGDEGAGDDDEAGEEDPGAEGGEEVVGARDGVEVEEHVDVAGLEGGEERVVGLGGGFWWVGV